MNQRTITLHTFCSVKGGVGKSTLAIVCAKLLARQRHVPVLVDCDLTGTSIADGLHLRAPKLSERPDGAPDLEAAPTGELYSLEKTRQLRRHRRDAGSPDRLLPPVYFNDILEQAAHREHPPRVDAALWRHEDPNERAVAYLPSSSIQRDITRSLDWLVGPDPFAWAQGFLWALDDLVRNMQELTDIVVDLPPGTWGFPHETMVIVATLLDGKPLPRGYPRWHEGSIRWQTNPFLVTSSDGNDILPALEYVGKHRARIPTLRLLANKFTEGDNVLERARVLFGSTLEAIGLDKLFTTVPFVPAMAEIFKVGHIPLSEKVLEREHELRLGEAR